MLLFEILRNIMKFYRHLENAPKIKKGSFMENNSQHFIELEIIVKLFLHFPVILFSFSHQTSAETQISCSMFSHTKITT